MAFRIPPGGFAGFAQMTPASRIALAPSTPTRNAPKRRRKAKKAARTAKRAARARGGRKLKFGSPAWRKKYMKKARR